LEADKLVNAVEVNLIKRCKKNDEYAYNQLISRHEAYLYRICYNYTRNKEETLDMMQEVYVKIFRGLSTFDESRPLLPWLKKIAINTMINHNKKTVLTETSLEGSWSEENTINPASYLAAAANTEEQVIFNDTRKLIEKMIAELPETFRLALTLRYHEDMSYDEIASVMQQPLGTVKSNVYRARKILHHKMQECELLEV